MHCHERGGTSGLHINARTMEIELVGDSSCEEVLVVSDHGLQAVVCMRIVQVRKKVIEEIATQAGSREDASRLRAPIRFVTGRFQRFPGTFEEHPVLRVHECSFLRSESKETGVKTISIG